MLIQAAVENYFILLGDVFDFRVTMGKREASHHATAITRGSSLLEKAREH
jgi:hypothetical protein